MTTITLINNKTFEAPTKNVSLSPDMVTIIYGKSTYKFPWTSILYIREKDES